MRRLVLFDIDGTLVGSRGGIGGQAFAQVLKARYGRATRLEIEHTAGRTDGYIAEQLLRALGVAEEELAAHYDSLIAAYVDVLRATYSEANGAYMYPGVVELLDQLDAEPGVTLGLLTGNIEPGARIKLAPFGLNRYFAFGAFGCDHKDRAALPAVAVTRARERTGYRFSGKEIVIVGDTEHDVTCGQHLGVCTVAVLTHPPFRDAVLAAGPDHLFEDFTDTAAVARAILG